MSHSSDVGLKRTPLNAHHRALGAQMVAFAGWDMPLEYSSIGDEHLTVRTHAGLFDLSHMGEVEIAGNDALAAVQKVTSNDASLLEVGQAQHSALTTPDGTFVDDLLVYKMADAHYLFVINASNIETDSAWIKQEIVSVGDAVSVNSSNRYAVLSLQGPRALEILQPLMSVELDAIRHNCFASGEVTSVRAMISRTGYTGENGFELFVPPQSADRVWNSIIESGGPLGLRPIGLGARYTLRLEASMRLYGHDIDETTTVLEAGLGWMIGWNKPTFTGKDALARQKRDGVTRKLVGFEMADGGIASRGDDVYVGDCVVGSVTSGAVTAYLKKAIGMAYVPVEVSVPDTEIVIGARRPQVEAHVVTMPFYARS